MQFYAGLLIAPAWLESLNKITSVVRDLEQDSLDIDLNFKADYVHRIMTLTKWVITHIAPLFIVSSPVTSYADQIWSISKSRSSTGFSLDIPLIMLVSSILKLFYWFGAHYDFPLLIQASVMVVVQLVLLHIALLNRPAFGAQHMHQPFAGAKQGDSYVTRPYRFWQWRGRRPYWQFLAYYSLTLAALQYMIGKNYLYIQLQGYVALGVEAILPIPQILENQRNRNCKGFRLSVLVNWLIGDVFKMTYFFLSEGGVPLAFKLCGFFQAGCDCYLGIQYWMFGAGTGDGDIDLKEPRLS